MRRFVSAVSDGASARAQVREITSRAQLANFSGSLGIEDDDGS
jgi:hypothetical protein